MRSNHKFWNESQSQLITDWNAGNKYTASVVSLIIDWKINTHCAPVGLIACLLVNMLAYLDFSFITMFIFWTEKKEINFRSEYNSNDIKYNHTQMKNNFDDFVFSIIAVILRIEYSLVETIFQCSIGCPILLHYTLPIQHLLKYTFPHVTPSVPHRNTQIHLKRRYYRHFHFIILHLMFNFKICEICPINTRNKWREEKKAKQKCVQINWIKLNGERLNGCYEQQEQK